MLNNIKALIERETTNNYKVLTKRLPLVLIIVVACIIFPSYLSSEKNILVILGISINLLFAMIFFSQIYLEELKDNEIKFLFTFLVDKNKIVISKSVYMLIIILFFNLILMIPAFFLMNNIIFLLNTFIFNVILSAVTGFVFLTFFLTSSYESFQNIITIVHEIIIGIFFILVSVIKTNLWNINRTFYVNPLFSLGFLTIVIFSSFKLLLKVFNNNF